MPSLTTESNNWSPELRRLKEEKLRRLEAMVFTSLRDDPANILSRAGKPPDPWQADLLRGSGKRIMLLCSRQSGKSTVAAALALKASLLRPGALVLLLSPTLRQSGELFRDKVRRLYNDLGRPLAVTQESALQMTLENGSRIISLPGDEETIRGYSGVTLLVIDEAARVPDSLYYSVRPMLAVSGGTMVALSTPFGQTGWFYQEWTGSGDWQRVRITAQQCPRISAEFLAEELRSLGPEWYNQEYGCEFLSATETPLFPTLWLDRAETIAAQLRSQPRQAKALGIDPAEGGDSSVWCIIDELGIISMLSLKTPNTTDITARTIALIREYRIPPERVVFDRGGGGKEHADRLRLQGYDVRTVAFGESVTPEPRRGMTPFADRVNQREERYTFVNRRAEMYHSLSMLLDPAVNETGFGIPAEYAELRRQLAVFPKKYDAEGRLYLPPKHRKGATTSGERTLVEMLGCSPDASDSLVLACHGLIHSVKKPRAGVA